KGKLKVEVLDEDGKVIAPFTVANCTPISSDKTLVKVNWKDKNLSALAGKPVQFRFHLTNGSLYAFWVSPDASGASYGYVSGGGPGFTGPTDTVGKGSL
ncbi:MAG: glycosyl hydrolase family 32, partial [Planctomycetota bacterium]